MREGQFGFSLCDGERSDWKLICSFVLGTSTQGSCVLRADEDSVNACLPCASDVLVVPCVAFLSLGVVCGWQKGWEASDEKSEKVKPNKRRKQF